MRLYGFIIRLRLLAILLFLCSASILSGCVYAMDAFQPNRPTWKEEAKADAEAKARTNSTKAGANMELSKQNDSGGYNSKQIRQVVVSDVDTPPLTNLKVNSKSYAVVIGIENYRQGLPAASFAANDAHTVTSYLIKSLGFKEENVVTLINDRALKSDLEKYFDQWLKNKVEKESSVFIYYSGHGAPNPGTGDAFIVPYDGDPAFIEQTGYSLSRLYSNLEKLPVKNVVVALDACFSGAGGKSVIAKGARALVRIEKANSRNIAILTASADNQISSTYEDKGHGVFTYFLLKGVKEKLEADSSAKLEVGQLYDYLKPMVEHTSRRLYNNEQSPQLLINNEELRKVMLR